LLGINPEYYIVTISSALGKNLKPGDTYSSWSRNPNTFFQMMCLSYDMTF